MKLSDAETFNGNSLLRSVKTLSEPSKANLSHEDFKVPALPYHDLHMMWLKKNLTRMVGTL